MLVALGHGVHVAFMGVLFGTVGRERALASLPDGVHKGVLESRGDEQLGAIPSVWFANQLDIRG